MPINILFFYAHFIASSAWMKANGASFCASIMFFKQTCKIQEVNCCFFNTVIIMSEASFFTKRFALLNPKLEL